MITGVAGGGGRTKESSLLEFKYFVRFTYGDRLKKAPAKQMGAIPIPKYLPEYLPADGKLAPFGDTKVHFGAVLTKT